MFNIGGNIIMLELLKFEDTQVQIIELNGEPLFEVYSTGMALGQAKWNGKRTSCTPHKQRINQNILNAEITPVVHNGQQYINESQLYDLMFEMKTDKVKPFRKWVTSEVLPQIRKTGGYIPINQNDTDEEIMARGLIVANKTIQQKDEIIAQKDKIIIQLRDTETKYNKFLNSQGYISMNKAAKGLKVGRNKMMEFLRLLSILFRDDHDNIPYQQFITSGYFIVDYHNGRDGKLHAVTKISVKGIEFVHRLYQKYQPTTERTVA
jgi:prophage antirepressor-like protein